MSSPAEFAEHGRPRAVLPQAQIKAALQADELRLHYLRIVSFDTAETTGVEALLRWDHPDGGLLYPDDFLPAVAHTPVVHEITRWVVRAAVRDLQHWPDWTVSVNITALDATRQNLVRDVEEALRDADVKPERLILELTEQAMVQNLDAAVKVLGSLRSIGVGLSLDDFGTGYSSLLYLRDLPLTELKIDRTFLAGVPRSEGDVAIVKSVAALGRSVGVRVVAEGIENEAQARVAQQAGCHAGQGYLWGAPQSPDRIDPHQALVVPRPSGAPTIPSQSPRTRVTRRIQELVDQSASLHTIAAALNREGLRTDKQVRWTARTVALVLSGLATEPHTGQE